MSLLLQNAAIPIAALPDDLRPTLDARQKLNPVALCDVLIEGETIATVTPAGAQAPTEGMKALDLQADLLLPGLVDAHTHLDKTHSWERAPNVSGTFSEAIQNLSADKVHWTEQDVYERASFALKTAWAQGTAALRTHLDIGSPDDIGRIKAIQRLQKEWAGQIELQWVPLCDVAIFATEEGQALADFCVENGACTLGGMPLMNPDLDAQLDGLMRLAGERGVGIDLHVDECGFPNAGCLRATAEAVLRNDFANPVACGHCCSLATQPLETQQDTLTRVLQSGLHVISLPMCNLYLQDRRIGSDEAIKTPSWRGITLLHEFINQGTTLACASDNVRDAFYAYGDYDMLEVFTQSVRIGHLDTLLSEAFAAVSRSAADVMGLPQHGRIAPGSPAQLAHVQAKSFSQLLSRPPQRRRISGENVLELNLPDYSQLAINSPTYSTD